MSEPNVRSLPPADTHFLARAWPWLLFAALFLTVSGLTCAYDLVLPSSELAPKPFTWTPEARDWLLVAFLCAGTFCTLGQAISFAVAKADQRVRRPFLTVALAALVFGAGLTYFYGAHGPRSVFPHLHDSFHYFLGAKYYSELGYDGLYDCTIEALDKTLVPNRTRVRDLHTDRHTTAGALRTSGAPLRCKQAFSPERWQAFERDVQLFASFRPSAAAGRLSDRGYNGSPLHTFIAQALANAVPLSYAALSVLILLDVLAVCLGLAALCWGFGHRAGLLTALLFFCQFVDRFQIIGGSFLRYQWFLALCLGLAFLKRERFFAAGVALTLSAFLNVFPVLFCLPIVLLAGLSWVRQRRLSPALRRIIQGASLASLVCVLLGAAHAKGFQNYQNFREAMRVHNAVGRAPGLAVGLKLNFVGATPDGNHSTSTRSRELKEARPAIVAAAAVIALAALYVSVQIGLAEGAVLVGFCGLFCIFGPTGYYYLFAPLWLLVFGRKTWDSGGLWLEALFFAVAIPPYLVLLNGAHRFYVFNRIVSGLWTGYLIVALGALLVYVRKRSAAGERTHLPSLTRTEAAPSAQDDA